MVECVKRVLNNIRQRPGVYFGTKALEPLADFISAYALCYRHYVEDIGECFPGFQDFVQVRYGVQESQHWSEIICRFSKSDSEAFDTFFKLLDECYGLDWNITETLSKKDSLYEVKKGKTVYQVTISVEKSSQSCDPYVNLIVNSLNQTLNDHPEMKLETIEIQDTGRRGDTRDGSGISKN